MKIYFTAYLLFILTFVEVQCGPTGSTWWNTVGHGPPTRFQAHSRNGIEVESGVFVQKLNHFDPLDQRTWKQRYYYSSSKYRPGAPVYFYLGGEWSVLPSELTQSYLSILATEHCAFMIVLQHRFYDNSIPEYSEDKYLQYLSSQQALEDAATFTDFAKSHFNLTGPWLVLGCSYGGNLAAWARASYPHIYSAAYASSAPVLAKYNFFEYKEMASYAYGNTSSRCVMTIKTAVSQIFELVNAGNSKKLQELFNTCELLNTSKDSDVMLFTNNIVAVTANYVQYAKPRDLSTICQYLTNSNKSPLEIYSALSKHIYEDQCMLTDMEALLSDWKKFIHTPEAWRLWIYQTCVEFGFGMTLDSSNTAYGSGSVTSHHLQRYCSDVFESKFGREVTEERVARTNRMFGGDKPDVSRVLYVHGTFDPWSSLRATSDSGKKSSIVLIKGATHCYDFQYPQKDDTLAVTQGRLKIKATIQTWLPKYLECK